MCVTRRLQLNYYKEQNLTLLVNSGTVFDAAWAMALALSHTADRVARNDSSGCSHLPGQREDGMCDEEQLRQCQV